jgi:hypothetical protein
MFRNFKTRLSDGSLTHLKGNIKAEQIGRFYRINHLDLMNALNEVKSLKYKR